MGEPNNLLQKYFSDNERFAMPIRTLLYDGMGYDEQLNRISKLNKREYDLTGGELLSGFRKEDRVMPIFTLVVYYGSEPWDGALDLHGLMNLQEVPEGIRSLIHNYPINLLQVNTFAGMEKFKTDLKAVFGFLQNTNSKDRLMDFFHANQEDFENLDEEAYDVISHLAKAGNLAEIKQNYKKGGGEYNMCKAILDMIEDGKEEGKREGQLEGKREGSDYKEKEIVLNMYSNKVQSKEIAQLTGVPLERVKEIIQP